MGISQSGYPEILNMSEYMLIHAGRLSGTSNMARLLVIATAHGLAIVALVSATAGLLWEHNPAVTLGLVLVRQMPVIKGPMYWVA